MPLFCHHLELQVSSPHQLVIQYTSTAVSVRRVNVSLDQLKLASNMYNCCLVKSLTFAQTLQRALTSPVNNERQKSFTVLIHSCHHYFSPRLVLSELTFINQSANTGRKRYLIATLLDSIFLPFHG